ncbi:ATPase family AAA domain-containing protein 2 isoform X2 [Halyomorpha halys]|uniref:ATPase family AAA domain-containing protein 2 isoform X2 n=1 Tax=Halyomorpha halys TaxID=286706 RepID=UPI0034D1FA57
MRRRTGLRITNKSGDSGEESEIDYQPKNNVWSRELRNRFVISSGKRSLRLESQAGPSRRSIRSCRIRVLSRSSHYSYPSEDEERMFTPSLSSRRLKNFREAATASKQTDGIRRSTRTKKLKYDNFNDSWIVGEQSLRGYPMLSTLSPFSKNKETIKEEEEEEEEDDDDEDDEEEEEEEEVAEKDEKVSQHPEVSRRGDDVKENGNARTSVPDRKTRKSSRIDSSVVSTKAESEDNGIRDTITENGYEDMYARVKQRRRQATKSESSSDSTSSSDEESTQPPRPKRLCLRSVRNAARVQRKYSLRQKKPTVERFQAEPISRGVLREVFTLRRDSISSSTSSSESGYDRDRKKGKGKSRNRMELCGSVGPNINKNTGLLADVDPVALDKSIKFSNIGGLERHITCLKEMVVFPILYPEVFEQFGVTPPKGVLFHGPPGTGKTLMARALANECSVGDRKVSFFMRKGADVLSKWVGESERQLRILFEEAQSARPSIIFFDELDGLAPVRSTKQDQIHASIVCTLLALMDGLDNRGDIIIIGATNRIDSIDPALRRPGRFDRELHFPLPGVKERREILEVHAGKWADKEVLNRMAETSVGYCGSDLKSLCTEAVIQALRRVYPQIYTTSQKLLINHERVKVKKCDFDQAQRSIVPAAQRVVPSLGRPLPDYLEPLLGESLATILSYVGNVFPAAFNKANQPFEIVRSPKLLIVGQDKETSLLAMGLMYKLEHCPMLSISLDSLYSDSSRSPEEAITKVFKELSHNRDCVLWFGEIGYWWSSLSRSSRAVFLNLLSTMDTSLSIFFLATSTTDTLPQEIDSVFSSYRGEVFRCKFPSPQQKEAFFRPLFRIRALKRPPPPVKAKEVEELKLAPPPPPPKLSEEQMKAMYEDEEKTLRELRIFLRQICSKLARNKQFYMFSKPVDIKEVPDYLQIIKEPMDLETMMTKIDLHKYTCAQDFLSDVDLLCRNALEYNPDRDPADKLIRHRACYLRDTAYALIKAEMDSDFEVSCRSIREARKKREENSSQRFIREFFKDDCEGDEGVTEDNKEKEKDKDKDKELKDDGKKKARKPMRWSKGIVGKKPRRSKQSPDPSKTEETSGSNSGDSTMTEDISKKEEGNNSETESQENEKEQKNERKVQIDSNKLSSLFNKTLTIAKEIDQIDTLVNLYLSFRTIIDEYKAQWDRNTMLQELEKELEKFELEHERSKTSFSFS